MSIYVNEENGLICLHTNKSTYQMKIDEEKYLIHTYYGSRIDNTDIYPQIYRMDRGFSGNPYEIGTKDRSYSLDLLPQEFSCFGTGDYRVSALKVKEKEGNFSAELKYDSFTIIDGLYDIKGLPSVYEEDKKSKSICILLKDAHNGLVVKLWYGVMEENDIIVRSVTVENTGKEKLMIEKAASVNLDFPYDDFDWITMYGRHAMERNVERRSVPHGISAVGSVRGASSHHYHPFSILCEKNATEVTGNCYGFSFLYSGEFLMEVEKDQANQIRFVAGINPENFSWSLSSGETLDLPQIMMTYSGDGLGQLSRNYHKTIQNNVCRGVWKKKRRPVLINNWEATYFDFTGDKLVDIAKEAHDMGIELFVMDDGWFGKRDDDNSGLGDWTPNEKKLGCTLKDLGERITKEGMLFGIWFEPEAISVDSDLYRNHPDWAIKAPNRNPILGRNELLLDYSRREVCDYLLEKISEVLNSAPISYVKWDMNRSMCDKYSHTLDVEHQGEFAYRYILGLYYVLDELHKRFPEILFEGCSGGGGRFDAGMLYYTPQIWCSDNTDAINRLSIQYGTSFGYPVSTMGAHVSAVPNHQTGRVTPLATRGMVAMAGTFGYELDITKMTKEEKLQVTEQIKNFHKYYDLIQYGDYYRLSTPKDICTVWEIVNEDRSQALITGVYHGVEANPAFVHVKVYGLLDDKQYKVKILQNEKVTIMSGISLKNAGITLPPASGDNEGVQIEIELER